MEQQPIEVKKITKVNSFLLAVGLAFLFLIICLPFLKNASSLSYQDKATIGNINMWRVVVGFGVLSVITSAYLFFKKKGHKFTILFLWIFWIVGFLLTYRLGSFQLNSESFNTQSLGVEGTISMLTALLPVILWLFGIYYCRKVAMRLGMSGSNAILAGIFLPVLSILLYFYFSYRKKNKEQKIKTLKIFTGTVIVIAVISAGAFYYILGTPEYSLYKLKQSIANNNTGEFEKYLDINSVSENFGELPTQSKEWIDSLNTSILEIKEENPDKSKDAVAYVDTDLSGKNLKNASLSFASNGEAMIYLKFDDAGAKLLADITKRNVGKTMAIFLSGDLASSPTVQSEITNGDAVISGQNTGQANILVNAINEEKNSQIDGFKIRKREVNGNSAKITIGKDSNINGFEISMSQMDDRSWKVNKIDTVIIDNGEAKLPSPEGEKEMTFDWKYKGKNYSLDQKLYDSYYKFYNSLPAQSVFNGESLIGELEKKDDLFTTENSGDKTISNLAQSIKELGVKNNLSENQIVELVASFVQTIPYDYDEYNNRETVVPKVDYPYEVLYKNKGICSDKSYLAYSLLRDLGYGVSFFLFPEDQHIAVGVECPSEYSNYDSGYCFLETTSLGNKIGSTPSLSKEFGVATAKVELSDFSTDSTESSYNPLGKIEILNKTTGLTYTGIIETVATQKKIDNLLYTIRQMDRELDASRQDLDDRDGEIGDMVDKLNKLAKNGDPSKYDDYNRLYSKYKSAYNDFEKDRKAFNAKVASRNQLNNQYNSLIKSFYQN